MNLLPIIVRELRAEARRPVNYWLRTVCAILLTILFGIFLSKQSDPNSGAETFSTLSVTVFCATWIVVPLLCADCISREKREGTLGLLFLTPLKPLEIMVGKGSIHALRSLTFVLTAAPVLAVPLALGGITRSEVLCSLVLDLTALCFALAAGLAASSLATQWSRALMLAEMFTLSFAFAFFQWAGFFLAASDAPILEKISYALKIFFFQWERAGSRFSTNFGTGEIVPVAISLFVISALTLTLVILFSAGRLKNSWQQNPPSTRLLAMEETFCSPRFGRGLLKSRTRSQLSRNPIGWLQQYSWSARLSKWGWCFVTIAVVSWLLTKDEFWLRRGCVALRTILLTSMTFSAVASFQREKQNGALELLLVTPLREKQIILGRLSGIWAQFFPSFFILALTSFALPDADNYARFSTGEIFLGTIFQFLALPVIGLFFAMRLRHFIAAWIATVGFGLFLPSLFNGMAQTGLLAYVAALTGILLYFDLKNRTFVLTRI